MADVSSAARLGPDVENVVSLEQHVATPPTDQNVYPRDYAPSVEVRHRPWPGKRIFDVCGSIAIAILISPLLAFIAISLAIGKGPIFFGHRRIGKNGEVFTCYKFRTMVPNAEEVLEKLFEEHPDLRTEWLLDHKLRNDPRVTWIGAFLRKTSLDELPQLWNVLRGDMSLVGPRPIVKEEIFRYGRAFRHYVAVKPGMTGLWQVAGRNDTGYTRRVALDRMYAMRSNPILDMNILVRTFSVVMGRKGAY